MTPWQLGVGPLGVDSVSCYSSTRRSRSAFTITDTELNVMAALAQIGLISVPVNGY